MRSLIVLPRGTVKRTFGGAEIQAIKTSKFLAQIGVRVNIAEADAHVKSHSTYDIIHIFDHTDAFFSSRITKKLQKKLVFTPIYWPEKGKRNILQKIQTYLTQEDFQFLFNQLRRPYSMTFYLAWRSMPDWVGPLRKIIGQLWLYPFRAADIIVVNSVAEKTVLLDIVGHEIESKTKIVYNGVDEEIYGRPITQKMRSLFATKYKLRDYVLSIGRIQPRKNQMMLIRACKKLDLPCVLIGRPYDRYYAQKVFKELKDAKIKYRYIRYLKPDSDMLISAYLNARIVALPSAFETPGLVALEAASLGRTVVVTKIGSAPEYFRENAYYVDPEDEDNITKEIQKAWNNPFDEEQVRKFVLENYPWKKTAQSISQIYQELVTKKEEMHDP
ncbi:glycosyltransferase family 4 protein [Candidatus Bathyarchaeota archaeon]|nr:glycosyltransferase family 4 protein [Candidatus Bathyarchaeota archaeon]